MPLRHAVRLARFAASREASIPERLRINAFDFLVVAFLNIGKFFGRNDGSTGWTEPEFFTLPTKFIRKHHDARSSWQKVRLRGLDDEIAEFKNEKGFELIAKALGVERPRKVRSPR